jgi:hypothetical protein
MTQACFNGLLRIRWILWYRPRRFGHKTQAFLNGLVRKIDSLV